MNLRLKIILIINLLAAAYGFFFFYGQQFLSTPPHLWIFVGDCPLASLLIFFALLGLYYKKKFSWFFLLSFATALKYSLWTMFVLSAYPSYYFTPGIALLSSMLFVAHIGLFAEAFLLLGRFKFRAWHIFPTIVWFFANDLSDYFLGTHPPIPLQAAQEIFLVTLCMSVFFILLSFWLFAKHNKPFLNVLKII